MGIEIREMTIADYAEVIAIWNEEENLTLRDADSRESINAYLDKNPGLSFIARVDSATVGAVLAGTDGRRGYLQHLAVQSDYRGRGVGRSLMQHCVAALRNIGIEKTHLFVHATNASAMRFYQRNGWFPRDEVRMFSYNAGNNTNA